LRKEPKKSCAKNRYWKYVKSIFKEIKTVGIIPIMSNTKFLVELPIQNTPTSKGHDISSTVPSNKLG